jgi:hypothetical protein
MSLGLIGRVAHDAGGLTFLTAAAGVPAWAAATSTRIEGNALGSRLEGHIAAFILYFISFLALGAVLLARVDLLRPVPIVVTGTTAIVAGTAILWHRRTAVAPGATQGGGGTRRRERLIAAAFLGGVVLLATPQLATIVARPDSVPDPTPWNFWRVSQQYQRAGGTPESSEEWGLTIDANTDYPGFSAAGAAVIEVTDGSDSMLAAQVFRMITVVGVLLAFFFLSRSWGASQAAALGGAAVLAALGYWAVKASSYRPEAYGYILMLLVPAFVTAYFATRRRSVLVAAAVGTAALSQIHGIALVVCGALVAGILAAELVRVRGRPALAGIALVAALLGGAWIVTDLVVNSRVRQLSQTTTLPEPGPGQPDATLEFLRETRADPSATVVGSFGDLLRSTLERGFAPDGGAETVIYAGTIATAGIAISVGLLMRRRNTVRLVVRGLLVAAFIGAICAAFQLGWETYVPRRTGATRILGAGLVLLPLVGSVAVAVVGSDRVRHALVAAWLSLGVLAVGVSASTVWGIRTWQPSRSALSGLRSIDLPPNSLVVTNAFSEGFVPAVLGRPGITDGRGPYLEGEQLLRRATRILDEAHQFFARPAERWPALRNRGVTHVLVGTKDRMFGTSQLFPVDMNALTALPDLRLVKRGDGFLLYQASESVNAVSES